MSWKEPTEPVRNAGQGFFPLDEELGLLPGSLTPLQQEHLVHLALWVSFPKAVKLLTKLMGVQVSEATARRQTEEAGAAYEAVQNEQASQLVEEEEKKSKKGRAKSCQPNTRTLKEPETKVILSNDGAMVPLVGGVWAEVKTVVIGHVKSKETPCKQRPEQQVETVTLSYFSRLTDAATFGRLATVETERRGVCQAKEVGAVQDGAEWIQGFVDLHRPDAVRILDFAHAAGYLGEIAELVRAAGTPLPAEWLAQQLHELKHHGPAAVLKEVTRLLQLHPHVPDLDKKVTYLCKREQHMQYPRYQEAGWPIGSGSVESANKGVVQARLKGAGMHWERSHVNPMLALRTAVCNDQWEQAWLQACNQRLLQRQERRLLRQKARWDAALSKLYQLILPLLLLGSPALSKTSHPQPEPPPSQPASCSTASTTPRRPASDHPWRRRLLAKK